MQKILGEPVSVCRKCLFWPRSLVKAYRDEMGRLGGACPEPMVGAQGLHWIAGWERWGYPGVQMAHRPPSFAGGDLVAALYDWCHGSAWTIDQVIEGAYEAEAGASRSNIEWRQSSRARSKPRLVPPEGH